MNDDNHLTLWKIILVFVYALTIFCILFFALAYDRNISPNWFVGSIRVVSLVLATVGASEQRNIVAASASGFLAASLGDIAAYLAMSAPLILLENPPDIAKIALASLFGHALGGKQPSTMSRAVILTLKDIANAIIIVISIKTALAYPSQMLAVAFPIAMFLALCGTALSDAVVRISSLKRPNLGPVLSATFCATTLVFASGLNAFLWQSALALLVLKVTGAIYKRLKE